MAFYDDALLINKEFHFYPLCGRLRKSFSHLRFTRLTDYMLEKLMRNVPGFYLILVLKQYD